MRWIRKNAPPHEFQVYVKVENATFEDMDTAVKDVLRQALFDEQSGICAYCQRKLKVTKTKIEHHCEQSICNGENGAEDKRLDYANLLLVCLGKGGENDDLHCDTYKATLNQAKGLPMQINPIIRNHMLTITYSTNGRIRSTNELYNKELNDILKLNIDYLKDMRKKKWRSIYSRSMNKSGSLNKDRMRKILEDDLAKKDNHFTKNFPGMSEYMKTKFC